MSLQHTFPVGELDVDHDGFTAVGVDHLGPPTIAVPILARIWRATAVGCCLPGCAGRYLIDRATAMVHIYAPTRGGASWQPHSHLPPRRAHARAATLRRGRRRAPLQPHLGRRRLPRPLGRHHHPRRGLYRVTDTGIGHVQHPGTPHRRICPVPTVDGLLRLGCDPHDEGWALITLD